MNSEMKTYYASRAPYYDAVYEKPERASDIAQLRTLLSERLSGRAVLEVACGTGYWTQWIAPRTRRYVATDGVSEPLALAKTRLAGICDSFEIADAYALPEHFGLFDGAFAGLWFSHIPIEKIPLFFTSLHARLTPGARVTLIDNSTAQLQDFPIVEQDARGNTFQHRRLRDGRVHRVLKNFPTPLQLEMAVNPFGAHDCTHRALDHFWFFEYHLPG